MRQAYTYCIKVCHGGAAGAGGLPLCFRQIVTLFRRDDLEVIEIGTTALRLQLCTLPLWAYIT